MAITATLIEYMPHYLRASHEAAGNRGVYPANGAEREWIRGEVDASDLDDWARVVFTSDDPVNDADGNRRPSWIARTVLDHIPDEAAAPAAD